MCIHLWFVHPCVSRLQRLVKDLLKQLQGQESGQWANNRVSGLDRTLGEISRILEKQVRQVRTSNPTLSPCPVRQAGC